MYIDFCMHIYISCKELIIIIILNQLTQFDYNMKTKKELNFNSSYTSFFKSTNKLQLNNKSTLNLQNSNQSNKSNQKSVGVKHKILTKDQSEQKLHLSGFSKYKASMGKKGRDNNISNIENKDSNLMPSRDNSAVKKGTDSKSYRSIKNVDLEAKSNRTHSKKVDFQNKAITKQRSHHSQNLTLLQNKVKKDKNEIEKKLYTFCDRAHPESINIKNGSGLKVKKILETQQDQIIFNGDYMHSQENLICNGTVVVRQEQLKRFTHKFARQKIETEETISKLSQELNKLQARSQQYEIQKLDFLECLQYKQSQIMEIKTKLSHAQIKAEIQKDQFMKWKFAIEQQIKQSNLRNKYLEDMLRIRDEKISQLLNLCDQNQSQLNKQELEIQNSRPQKNNYYLPLANIHHVLSINTSSSNQSPPKISEQLLEQLQYLRRQYLKKDTQTNQSLMYMRIENDYICKELVLQKEANASLKQEVDELKSKIFEHEDNLLSRNVMQSNRQTCCNHENQIQSLKQQVSKSMIKILHLQEKKQILQRSLKVSSEMIIKLKQQNEKLKRKQTCFDSYHEIDKKNQLVFSEKDVQSIILKMMKQQLQMQDKVQNQLYQSIQSKRKATMKNSVLQKRYEEGYKSVKRSARENRNYKTEHSDENIQNDFHSEAGYCHQNQNSISNWANSQGQSSLQNLSGYKKQLF